jgi:site-specific DNA-methyltransferase (adenine-specific)
MFFWWVRGRLSGIVPRIVPTQSRKRVENGIFGRMDVSLRDADIRVSGDSRKRPHVTAAFPQSSEERVPDRIFFLWEWDNPGQCRVSTHFKDWPVSTSTRPLLEEGADVFIRFNEGLSILKKVAAVENTKGGADSLLLPENKRFDRLVSSRKPFGLDTKFKGKVRKGAGDILVYQNGGTGYIPRKSIRSGAELIDEWKVYTGYAAPGTGNKDTYPHRIISTPFIGEPETICSETYLCIGPFASKSQAESVLSYLTCRLPRLHKPSQHTTRKVYTFVPTQEWTRPWTDGDLYKKYGLTESEIAFIEGIVRPMETTCDLFDEDTANEGDDE